MKELLSRLAARPGIAAELIAASLFANVLALASPLFVIQVLNRYVSQGVSTTLATLTAGVLVAILFELGFRQVRLRLAQSLGAPRDRAMSEAGFGTLVAGKVQPSEMLSAGLRREIVGGADVIQAAYNPSNVAAVLDAPFALVFVAALFLLSPVLAAITVVILALVLAGALASAHALRRPAQQLMQVAGRRSQLIGGAIAAADAIRAFNAAEFVRRLWHGESQAFRDLGRRVAARQGLIQALMQSAQAVLSVAIIAVGGILVVDGKLDVGGLIGANILAARALGPLIRVSQLGESFAKARQSLDMLREFAKLPAERAEGTGLAEYRGAVELRDLAFAYPGASQPLFEHLSLALQPGATLVVAGGNGTGKTTLARLMVKLLDPVRGQILIDGVDLAQVSAAWWRTQVVYLPQEPRFLNVSLRDNILAFNPALDEAALNRLVVQAGLRRYVDETSGGLDSVVAGNGESLPVGIRRRLALARALARDGVLGVFDEPTEGLDKEGAARVYAAMNEMARRGRTIVAFSHDPHILRGAQSILDLNAKPVPRLIEAAKLAEALRDPAARRPLDEIPREAIG